MEGEASKYSSICLLLVDVQEDFYSYNEAIGKTFPNFVQNVTRLLADCRSLGIEVVHIRAIYELGCSSWLPYWKLLNPEKKGIVKETPEPFAVAQEGEKIVTKHAFDGFLNTELDGYLKEKGKKIVILCGLITSCCVLFTTSGAFMRGYLTCVVEDCCGDRTNEKHNSTMDIYGAYMFTRLTVDKLKETCDLMLDRLANLNTTNLH